MTLYELPRDLPVPVDDGACDHLEGLEAPALTLESSLGPVDMAEFATKRGVLYVYPRTGRPDWVISKAWDETPGARGCTPQSCGFRDHLAELCARGAKVAGASTQGLVEQIELSERLGILHPVISDPERKLGETLDLPTFQFDGATLYRRVTLVFEAGRVAKVFYPVFPPDRSAEEVIAWLAS